MSPYETFLRPPPPQELSRDCWTLLWGLFPEAAGVLHTWKNWFKQELVEFRLLLLWNPFVLQDEEPWRNQVPVVKSDALVHKI